MVERAEDLVDMEHYKNSSKKYYSNVNSSEVQNHCLKCLESRSIVQVHLNLAPVVLVAGMVVVILQWVFWKWSVMSTVQVLTGSLYVAHR